MKDRILLSTYAVRLTNLNKDNQILQRYNGQDDFLDFIKKFTDFIFANTNQLTDRSGTVKIHFTLEEESKIDSDERCVYGLISSGVGGDKFKLVDMTNQTPTVKAGRDHVSFRELFFYFYIPKNKDVGYLILQRKTNFGVKDKLKEAINSYMRSLGVTDYCITFNNLIHEKVFKKMMAEGNLKKVDLIKSKIPFSMEDYVKNGINPGEVKGKQRISFSSYGTLPNQWKDDILTFLKIPTNKDATLELSGLNEYEDIEFELELYGKRKTYYVKKQYKTQPDVDVTNSITFDLNGDPLISSLVETSKEMIADFETLKKENAYKN